MSKRIFKNKRRATFKAFGFSSVYIIFTLLFFVFPAVWMVVLVFSKWNFLGTPKWDGIHNIIRVFTDDIFWISVWNVFKFMVIYIPMVFISSVLFALGLKKLKFGVFFVAMCFFIAQAAPGVGYSIVFKNIFSPTGPINGFLFYYFNFTIPWFTSPTLSMVSIAIMVTWKFVGFYGIILYSGMNAIPQPIYEAAEVDGSSKLRTLFKITIPLLNPQLVMIMVLAITLGFGIFTEVYMITSGGPLNTTMMPMLVMYNTAFRKLDPTFSATMAIVVAIISYITIIVTRKIIEREVTIAS
jgi:multiple sugar transport system permease protein